MLLFSETWKYLVVLFEEGSWSHWAHSESVPIATTAESTCQTSWQENLTHGLTAEKKFKIHKQRESKTVKNSSLKNEQTNKHTQKDTCINEHQDLGSFCRMPTVVSVLNPTFKGAGLEGWRGTRWTNSRYSWAFVPGVPRTQHTQMLCSRCEVNLLVHPSLRAQSHPPAYWPLH